MKAPIETSPLAWLEAVEQQRRQAGLRRSRGRVPPSRPSWTWRPTTTSVCPSIPTSSTVALRHCVFGGGATGSRLVTGDTELHQQFESELADFSVRPRRCCSPRVHGQPRRGRRPVRSGLAAGVRRPLARLAGGCLPAVAGAGGGDAAPRCQRRGRRARCPRRGARRRHHRLGAQCRRHVGPGPRAARRLSAPPGAARRRRGARPRGPRRRPWPAVRARARGRARRRDDHDAVQGARQPGRGGARARGGAGTPDRRGPAVHLRHRPGAGGGRRRAGGTARPTGRTVAPGRRAAHARELAEIAASPRCRRRRWCR